MFPLISFFETFYSKRDFRKEMKKWTVNYRNKNGSKASVVIESEDRAGVFGELKMRGISAISVTEGASNKKPRKAASSGAPSKGRGLIAAAIVVLVAGIAAWWMWPEKEKVVEDKKPNLPRNSTVETIKSQKKITVEKEQKHNRITAFDKMRGMTGAQRRDFIISELEKREIDLTPSTNQPFKTGIELSMARIFMTEVGDLPPPPLTTFLPIQDEVHLEQILLANNPIVDGDNEKTIMAKEIVKEVKKELRTYINEGGDVQSFMQFYYNKLVNAYEERMQASRMAVKIAKEEPDIVYDYIEEVNQRLSDKGIKGIFLPKHIKKQLNIGE